MAKKITKKVSKKTKSKSKAVKTIKFNKGTPYEVTWNYTEPVEKNKILKLFDTVWIFCKNLFSRYV